MNLFRKIFRHKESTENNVDKAAINMLSVMLDDPESQARIKKTIVDSVCGRIESNFLYGGEGYRIINKKISDVTNSLIEKSDISSYTIKIESIISEAIRGSSFTDYKKLTENINSIFSTDGFPERFSKISLSDIFEKWKQYVADNINTSLLEVENDGESVYYEPVEVSLSTEYSYSLLHVNFTCTKDKDMNYTIILYETGKDNDTYGFIRTTTDERLDFNNIRSLSFFDIYMMKAKSSFCNVIFSGKEDTCSEVEPSAEPELTYT